MLKFLLAPVAMLSLLSATRGAPLRAQTMSLSGTVFSDTGSITVSNAELVFIGLKKSARSDHKGNFGISDIPMGSHELMARSIGYQPSVVTMAFTNAEKVEADIMLAPTVTKLEEIGVLGKDMTTVPAQFAGPSGRGGARCSTIVLWTRW